MSRPLIRRACGLTVILALCAPGGHGLHSGARGLPDPAPSPVLATVRVGSNPVALAVDPRSRHVLVVNGGAQADANGNPLGPGSVSLLDATTGAVLRTVPAGRGLDAIAVDAQTQRAFVLGETTVSTLDTRSGAVVRAVTPRTGPADLAVDVPRHQVFVPTGGAPATHRRAAVPPTLAVLDAASGTLRRSLSSPPSFPHGRRWTGGARVYSARRVPGRHRLRQHLERLLCRRRHCPLIALPSSVLLTCTTPCALATQSLHVYYT